MHFAFLGSGSRGNGMVIAVGRSLVLLGCRLFDCHEPFALDELEAWVRRRRCKGSWTPPACSVWWRPT